jgi:hypothetical protein
MIRLVSSFVGALALLACGGEATCEWGGESWAAGECGKTTCRQLGSAASEYVKQARVCDPKASQQCTELVGNLGCPTYVNAEHTSAIDLLAAVNKRYGAMSCYDPDAKVDCLWPDSASCSAEGQCKDNY